MPDDERIEILAKALRLKHYQLSVASDFFAHKYFNLLAEECLKTLDEYYGAARYWMAAEFERGRVLRELEATIDRIRNADISP
jgi:hypothetical protein